MNESILVIADEAAGGEMCRVLERIGYAAVQADPSGQVPEILDRASAADLAIADLDLPGIESLSLAQQLVEQDPDRPVLLLVGRADREAARRAIDLGVYECFAKPVDSDDLTAGVRRALERRRLALENEAYRRSTEQELKMRSDALAASTNAIAIADNEGVLSYVNPSFLELWEYEREKEVLGKHAAEFWQMEGRTLEVIEALHDRGSWIGELTARRRDGSPFPVNLSASMVRDEEGNALYMLASFLDITERRQHEEALQRAQEELEDRVEERTAELEAANSQLQHEIAERKEAEQGLVRMARLRALEEMAAGVSHNMNNILSGILTPAQRIQNITDDSEVLRYVETVIASAIRATNLVQRLRQAVQGVEEATLHPVVVNDAVRDAVEEMQLKCEAEASDGDVSVEVVADLNAVCPIRGTRPGLRDILINLLSNAAGVMPEGGRITIGTRTVGNSIQITVEDTGPGMDEEVYRRIFDPFATTDMDIGSGLGLLSVYSSVTRWGGTIDAESRRGKGTVFKIRFPAWAEYEAERRREGENRQRRRGKVLIVEGEKAISHLLYGMLSLDHDVTTVLNENEALRSVAATRYDVALIDQEVRGIPAERLGGEIRRTDASVVTVLIARRSVLETEPDMSAFDFEIQKPFANLFEVQDLVGRAMDLHDTRKEDGDLETDSK